MESNDIKVVISYAKNPQTRTFPNIFPNNKWVEGEIKKKKILKQMKMKLSIPKLREHRKRPKKEVYSARWLH